MYYDTVFLGHSLSLFLPPPNWRTAVRITPRFGTVIDGSVSSREDRAASQECIRFDVQASFILTHEETASLHAEVSLPRADYVGIPIFPDSLRPEDWGVRCFDAPFVLNYDETGFEIFARADVPEAPARRLLAPLLVGRLIERPKLKLSTDQRATFTLKITDRSPWDFRIDVMSESVGEDWPVSLGTNWKELPEDWTEDDIQYVSLGDVRAEAVTGIEGAPKRAQSGIYTLVGRSQIRTFLNFFLAKRGQTRSFVIPWNLRPTTDSAQTPHSVKVRFASDHVDMDFVTDGLVHVKCSFIEVPWELTPIAGESPEQPSNAWLYRYSMKTPGGAVYWRFTSWERPLQRTEGGNTVTYLTDHSIEHDQISIATDLTDSATSITSYVFQDNPVLRLLQRKMDVPLSIDILSCDPTDPESATLRYSGDVVDPDSEASKITAPTVVLGGLLDVKVPTFNAQVECNYDFCSPGCQLSMSAIQCTGTVVSRSGYDIVIAITSNPSGKTLSADWFAGGTVEIGDLETYEVRHIVRSTAIVSGHVTLTMKRPFLNAPTEAVVKMKPTCTGTKAECKYWNNYINFGGQPQMGEKNLSLPSNELATPGGKK